jgi:DNA-binding Xre family transcriptional regulator
LGEEVTDPLPKGSEWGHKITYDLIKQHAHISSNTIARLMSLDPIDRIDGSTLDGLCGYLGCQVGDILEYVANDPKSDKSEGQ